MAQRQGNTGATFIDCYNHEFSRDIEPCADDFTDVYYYYMADYVRRYTDMPGKAYFSCHVNAWAILAGAADSGLRTELSAALTEDPGLTGCTLYFAFYLLEAMHRTGNDAGFETVLKQWEPMLELGFTTFPECPSADTRSDCHAWSAGPLYHLLRHYAGVYPAEPGYAVVGVEPAAGAPPFTAVLPVGGGRLLTVSGRPGDGCTLSSASRLRIRRVRVR